MTKRENASTVAHRSERKLRERNSKLEQTGGPSPSFAFRISSFATALWGLVRTVSGDDAYERYLAHHWEKHAHEGPPLNRKEFYRRRLEHKYDPANPSRCC